MNVGDLVMSLRSFDSPNVFNPWRHVDPLDRSQQHAAMDRRTRLYQHFDCDEPRFLLVGEAPGYQGCHFSGVPFTNEALICGGAIPRVSAPQNGRLAPDRFTTRDKPWSEPSATIVWRVLHTLSIAEHTVMWNAFAFHPHKPNEPMSNRAPTRLELQAARWFLESVLAHFKGVPVVAVGRVAQKALTSLGIAPRACVRHPSMGGAHEFEDGMGELVR